VSQNNLQFTELTAPGKVFILGEYAILAQLSAVVATVEPRFSLRISKETTGGLRSSLPASALFHPQSPAGKLIAWAERSEKSDLPSLDLQWEDPHLGQGGFGASTAQFALVYFALAENYGWPLQWESMWRLYRDLTGVTGVEDGIAPSGADVVAQWMGGITLFEYQEKGITSKDLSGHFDWNNVLIFSAAAQEGRKVPTHEHLARMKDVGFLHRVARRLSSPLSVGVGALRENDPARLGFALREYAKILQEVGLELEATTRDRQAFQKLQGVLGVKGAGAMQADALVIVVRKEATPNSTLRQEILEMAKARQLVLMADGIKHQAGVPGVQKSE